MSSWGWKKQRRTEETTFVPQGFRALAAAVPWLTVGLLFLMVLAIGSTLTVSHGALFALPDPDEPVGDVSLSSAVALLMPTPQGTLIYFDDTRYVLEDDLQRDRFSQQLEDHMKKVAEPTKTLLALVDLRVRQSELMRFTGVVKRCGVDQVLFAERHVSGKTE